MAGRLADLDDFYAALRGGLPVSALIAGYERMVDLTHAAEMTAEFRLGSGQLKKLKDEVLPVVRFVRLHATADDLVRFAIGSSYPDCEWVPVGKRKREIEVTVGQAKERLHTMRELNECGKSRGFVGLSDSEPQTAFEEVMRQPREGYSIERVVRCVSEALASCVENKSRHQGDILLIEITNLQTLPDEQWLRHLTSFQEAVHDAPFAEVYMTGRSHDNICLRLV
jgi:hypothetical protein